MWASPIDGAAIGSAGGVLSGCCKTQRVVGSRCIGGAAGAAEKAFGGSREKKEERKSVVHWCEH